MEETAAIFSLVVSLIGAILVALAARALRRVQNNIPVQWRLTVAARHAVEESTWAGERFPVKLDEQYGIELQELKALRVARRLIILRIAVATAIAVAPWYIV